MTSFGNVARKFNARPDQFAGDDRALGDLYATAAKGVKHDEGDSDVGSSIARCQSALMALSDANFSTDDPAVVDALGQWATYLENLVQTTQQQQDPEGFGEKRKIKAHCEKFREQLHKAGATEESILKAYSSARKNDPKLTAAAFLNAGRSATIARGQKDATDRATAASFSERGWKRFPDGTWRKVD